MKKLRKILMWVVILIVVAVVAVFLCLDSIVKTGVEKVGPQVAKVAIKLDGVSISVFSGSAKLKGLFVGNPEGFKTESAIKVGKVTVAVEPGSVLSKKIIVHTVNVDAPEITFEGSLKGNNLSKILENVQAFVGTESGKSAPTDKKAEKKLQVDEFVITGGKVNVSMNMGVMGGKSATVPLPEIRLKDLGKGDDGLTPAELTEKVMKEVMGQVTTAVSGMAGELGKGAVDAGKGAVDGAGKTVKGIGDLFKKK